MKKVLGSLAALSALGATAAIQHAEAAAPESSAPGETSVAAHTVDADSLRVRTGPGTSYGILGHVTEGQALEVTGEEQGWYEIDYNGQTAYVSKDYVSSNAYTVTVSSLRVRSGPSTSHPVLGYVQKGQEVTVTAELQHWYKIDYNGQSAYVSKDYVSKDGEDQASQTSVTSVQQGGTYVVTAASLRVRAGAGVYHSVIGGVVEGQQLQVEGVENGWYRINHNGVTGYVSSEYVSLATGGTAAAAAQDRYVTVDSLHVRSGAGTGYAVLGNVSLGQKLEVSNEQNGFFQISYNGQTGYVSKDYLSTTPVAQATAPAQAAAQNQTPAQPASNTSALLSYAKSLIGVPYVWGGTTPAGFDCSGFVYHVYHKFNSSFGRTSTASYWGSLTHTSDPQPGDLIFFQNTYTTGPSHMGIYLGGGSFIQAGDSGVAIGSLSNPYWKQHFLGYAKAY